ncbi:hypothetical protein O6P43_000888 [Quillaja saponaria]|uniref:Uncharacterized protein n=1 Tax=Quillaja saponaria TaxID=32244 RepID=A0AAD7VN62_QUISA|nr:hypothetical protein O6P43_000888 [Quillaja saponaria]
MGGGAALTATAKVAGIGVATGGLRGVPVMPSTEQSVRNASRPVSAILSSEGAKSAQVLPVKSAAAWDRDDWEFADEDDLVMEVGESMPRVVFKCICGFFACDQVSGSSVVSSSKSETKSCVIETTIATPSVPKHALQAFKLLSTSPEAQNVVTSIASDPNVWNAVLDNPMVKDFLLSHQMLSIKWKNLPANSKKYLIQARLRTQNSERVIDVVAEKTSSGVDGNAKATFMDNMTLGASFMGLVVLVIMVVVLKRV